MNDPWKSSAIVVAGALLSTAVALLPGDYRPWRWVVGLLAVAVLLLAWGSGILGEIADAVRRTRRRFPWSSIRVVILNDMGWDPADPHRAGWTDISPEQWKAHIEHAAEIAKVPVRVQFGAVTSNHASRAVVVNPYGSVYPEIDLEGGRSLEHILQYVRGGGTFVNVADVPSYFAYSPTLRRRVDATPAVFVPGAGLAHPFPFTPLLRKLGLTVRAWTTSSGAAPAVAPTLHREFQFLAPAPARLQVDRVVVIESNVETVIDPFRVADESVSPIVIASFGAGRVVLSTLFLNAALRPSNVDVPRILARLIVELCSRKRR